MNLYPALRARMGTWEYYTVAMPIKDVCKDVGFLSELGHAETTDDATLRPSIEDRAASEVVRHLGRQEERLHPAIVAAVLRGNPMFTPLRISDDERFGLLFKATKLDESLGVLTLDGTQSCYAVDGQHHLKALKALVERKPPANSTRLVGLDGILDEEVPVTLLVPHESSDAQFLARCIRTFTVSSRHAATEERRAAADADAALRVLQRPGDQAPVADEIPATAPEADGDAP